MGKGLSWGKGYLDVTDNSAPLYKYAGVSGSVAEVKYYIHGTLAGFTSLQSNWNNIDCTVGGNHQIARTSISIIGVNDENGGKAKLTDGNIQAYVAGGYINSFTASGKLTIDNIEFTSTTSTTVGASAAKDANSTQEVTSAEMEIKNCKFNGRLYVYDNFDNAGVMTYNIHDNVFDGANYNGDSNAYAIFAQCKGGNNLIIADNKISGFARGINIDHANVNATISGNKISIKDAGRSCIQLSSLTSTVISNNTLELTGGNAITLHEKLLTLTAVPEITVKGNTITGNGYLIYDDAVANNKAFTSENLTLNIGTNTVASTVETTHGVKGSDKFGLSETVATVVDKALTPAYVATVNGVGYATLAEAIAAAKDGDTVTLIDNLDISTTGLTIAATKTVTLDLNGHALKAANTNTGNIKVLGKLTLCDSTDTEKNGTGTGKVWTDTPYIYNKQDKVLIAAIDGGTFTMESGLIDTASSIEDNANNGQFAVSVQNEHADATVIINGGHIKAGWYAVAGNGTDITYNGNITVNGGILESVADYAIYHPHTGTTTVNGGVIFGAAGGISLNRGKLIVNDGTITSKGTGTTGNWGDGTGNQQAAAINVNAAYETTAVEIKGGKITAEKDAILLTNGRNGTVAVSGGSFSSEIKSEYCADGFVPTKNEDGTYGVKAGKYVAQIGDVKYETLAAALAAAKRNNTVTLLADTRENVTISTPYVTLDLNGHTLNGGTEKGKPALTITARVTVKDSSAAQTGTIMREDTAENSGVSSHYVIDIQGSGWLTFESGTVKNNSGSAAGKGASLVRVGNDSVAKYPGLNIKGGTFTQDNFIVIKVDSGDLFLNGGTLNSANSYAIENWHRATIKGGTVNGTAAAWTYSGGLNSTLEISGGTVNGDVESISYDGTAGKKASVSITGGTVNGTLSTKRYDSATEPSKEMATIEVTGGTFTKDPTKYVIEDSAITKNADGTFGVAKAYLAKVGENSYYTMDEAFKAQTASGEPIVLLRDYTTGSPFNSGSINRTVDLNGFTWTCTGTDANSAAFEINYPDVTLTVKNGTIVSSQLVGLIPSAMGGTLKYDNSGLVFENVEMSTTATSGIETNGNNTNDTVTLKNSTLNVPNGFGIYFPSSGKLTLDNSTVNAKTMGVQVCAGSLSINEGSAVTVTGDAVPKSEKDGAIQDGAAISIVNRTGYKGLDTVTISGGKFTAKEGNSAIKAYNWVNNTESDFTASEKVAVSGGTFSSAVPADLCAEGLVPVANTDGTYGVKAGKYVAQIGDVKYETLADALAAANAGDTVTLLADINTPEKTYEITKSLTIDLNGKTVTGSGYDGVFEVTGENIKVVLDATNGGKVIAVENSGSAGKYAMAVWMCGAGSTLTINGGEFIQNITSTNDKQMDMIYASAGTIIINSGSFTSGTPKWTLNINDSAYKNGTANIIVNGGTFTGYDPRNAENEGKGTSLVADGVGIDKNADGTFTAKSGMAAQIVDADGNSVAAYATLADAIAAANAGETVKLLADVTADVVIDKNITLDLGGKTLTNTGAGKATISIANGATVTVKNGNVIGGTSYYNIEVTKGSNANLTLEDVTATAGNTGSSMIDNWGTITIKSGTYTGGLNVVKSEEGSTLVINGGKFELNYAVSNKYNGVILSAGITTISGGEFIQNATTPRWGNPQVVLAMQVDGYTSKIEITGGTFTNKKSGSNIFHGVGKATSDNFEVSGGTFNKSVSESYCAEGFIPTKNADGTYGVKEGKFVVDVGSTGYETFDEAIAAANASASSTTIYLRENLTVDHQIIINNTKGKKITLNLKSFTLTSTYADTSYSLLTRTAVTIKNGTYKSTNESARGIGAYADFVLDGVTVDVAGLVGVACSESGKTYVIKNSVVKAGYAVCNFANNATITISDSTLTGTGNVLYHNGSNYGLKLTVTNSTITGTSDDCCGVYISGSTSAQANSDNQNGAGGYQQATFTKCTISGTNGIEVKYTDLTLDGCTVISTSDAAPSYTQNNNGPAASGFAVVSTDNATQGNTPKPEGTIIVKGEGKYTGPVGLGSLESVKTSYAGFNDETIKVSGGTFSSAVPEEYCAEGFIPTKNADGTYGVKEGMYVAQIGDVKYETLKDAFAAAKDGDTITIVRNFTTDETKTTAADRATVTANVTLDFGSYVMTVPASLEPTDNFMAILVDGSTLTVEGTSGGIVSGDAETCGVYGFNVKGGGKLVINGGGYYCGITVAQAQLGTIEVNGGSFAVNDGSGKYPGYMFNCVDANYVAGTAGITVNGGTFVGYDPRNNTAEGTGTSFVAEGVGIDKNADGTFTAKSGMAAQIVDADGNSVAAYATLADAIAAANAGETVKLLADVTLDAAVKVPAGKNVTLDLNGKKLSTTTKTGDATRHYYAIDNYGTFTLRDSSAEQSGEIRARGIENLGTGTMTIESGKIVAIDANGGAAIWNNANLTINGGTFVAEYEGTSNDPYGPGCVYNNGTLTINGGTFMSANKRTYAIVSKAGTVTITPADGKNVTISGAHGGLGIDGGTAIINGGSYASSDYYGLYVSNDAGTADVTVNGGTFTGKKYSVLIGSDGSSSVTSTLKIKGGTFDMPIHAQENTIDGAIAISGGKFKFKVDDKYFDGDHACSTDTTDGYYTVAGHPIISAGLTISADMSFRVKVRSGYENGSLRYYYDTIGENNTIVRVEGEGILGATDADGNSIFRIYNVNPQRADLVYTFQYYDAEGNAVGTPKQRSVIAYFEDFYNLPLGDNEDLDAKKTFIANFLEYCASAMERSYDLHKDVTLNGKTWQDRADAVREMMTRLGLAAADYEFKGNLGRYYKDNSEGIILKRGVVFGSTFKAYYQISKEAIDDNGYRVFRQGMDVTDKLELVDGAYRLYFELAPYEFKDNLTITVNNGTTKVCEYTSPLANTLEVLSKSTDASLAKMAKAAFNYFVALQNYNG